MTLTDHVCVISESKLHKSILCTSSGGFNTKTQLQKCYLTGIWMRSNDSLGRGKHYCYKLNPLSISKRPLNPLKGTFALERMQCSFKIQFWASRWHEEKNWDIETEDPETIHASVSRFFSKRFSYFSEFLSIRIFGLFLFERIILLIILLVLVM